LSKTRISLLIELLKTFTDKEFAAFTKFVESQYFNALKAEKYTEELQFKVYEDTYANKPLKQNTLTKTQYIVLNNQQRKLLRLAEKFLIVEKVSTDNTIKPAFLYNTLIDRNQNNLYQRHLKNDLKKLNSETVRGLEYYTIQYKLQEVTLDFLINNGQIVKEDNYDQLQFYLDLNYLLKKLMHYLAQITLKDLYEHKTYRCSSLNEISGLLAKREYADNPMVKIYLSNIALVENKNDKSYQNLVETLALNHQSIPPFFLRVFYINLTNYCISQLKKGQDKYYQSLFEIYKTMHQHNLLIHDNLIDSYIIKNVITVSCRNNSSDWAENVLEHYKKFIHIKIRDSVYFYNKGVIAFYKKNYALAQDWFLKVNKVNDIYEIGLRIFMLQCIFDIEPDFSDATKQSFESAKQFFKRNAKLSFVDKTSYLNFVAIFSDLYKYKHQATKTTLTKIKDRMHKMEVIHKKKWLVEKMEELN